ncbi:hypothetical protein Mapa_006970 [Marchantia paleacea]|nr:hypothetical protein Mapa_006970 [Marchantia paleacea]
MSRDGALIYEAHGSTQKSSAASLQRSTVEARDREVHHRLRKMRSEIGRAVAGGNLRI